MANIIYKVFRGDELLKINTETFETINLYNGQYGQRMYGSFIVIKEDGVLSDEKNVIKPVKAGDVILVNYDGAFVINDSTLGVKIEDEIANRKKKELQESTMNDCKCAETTMQG